jgi:hypothetical protein
MVCCQSRNLCRLKLCATHYWPTPTARTLIALLPSDA